MALAGSRISLKPSERCSPGQQQCSRHLSLSIIKRYCYSISWISLQARHKFTLLLREQRTNEAIRSCNIMNLDCLTTVCSSLPLPLSLKDNVMACSPANFTLLNLKFLLTGWGEEVGKVKQNSRQNSSLKLLAVLQTKLTCLMGQGKAGFLQSFIH